MSAWESPVLSVVDTKTRKIVREVGPFTNYLCPFTINGKASQVFANVDGLVGFEVGDLQTGLILDRVVVEGYQMDVAEKFECPSHGIGLTPDERELWVADGVDNRIHVFDATTYPPVASTIGGSPRAAAMDHVRHRRAVCVSFERRCHRP